MRIFKRIAFSAALHLIERSDDQEISQIIESVIRRYATVYPDWEVMFLSLPKDPVKRRQQLDLTIDFMRKNS